MQAAAESSTADPASPPDLQGLIAELSAIRAEVVASENRVPASVHPQQLDSAVNLQHYLTLRHRDLRPLQGRLAELGLSSLGRSESHVLASLDAVLATLCRLAGQTAGDCESVDSATFHRGQALLQQHTEALLGREPEARNVRIMVTMPSEAATDYRLVQDLLHSGMDCMRINCAHDGPEAWSAMLDNLRRAEEACGRRCRVSMDLAGPKLRTGPIDGGPPVVRYKPVRNTLGQVTEPARVWVSAREHPVEPPAPADVSLQVAGEWLSKLAVGDEICFQDTRDADRRLEVVDVTPYGAWLSGCKTAYLSTSTVFHHHPRGGGKKRRTPVHGIPPQDAVIHLHPGDRLILTPDTVSGRAATRDAGGEVLTPAFIGCTLPEVLSCVRVGEEVWFDDGKIGGEVENIRGGALHVRIRHTGAGGGKLRGDKGINFPGSRLNLAAMTEKDACDLDFVARHADLVALSFANTVSDVEALKERLWDYGERAPAVVLKIETVEGFRNLPAMLLAAMSAPVCGVMIARGDLAVEAGFERLAEVQEEILWLCEAAHVPVIWATQVLETQAKTGAPTRAEITDAAMGHRAECVMLNKGPHIVETVRTLDNILRRMQGHQFKKQSMLRELSLAGAFCGTG